MAKDTSQTSGKKKSSWVDRAAGWVFRKVMQLLFWGIIVTLLWINVPEHTMLVKVEAIKTNESVLLTDDHGRLPFGPKWYIGQSQAEADEVETEAKEGLYALVTVHGWKIDLPLLNKWKPHVKEIFPVDQEWAAENYRY